MRSVPDELGGALFAECLQRFDHIRVRVANTWFRFSTANATSSDGASTFCCTTCFVRAMPTGLFPHITSAICNARSRR